MKRLSISIIVLASVILMNDRCFGQFKFVDATEEAKLMQSSVPLNDIGAGVVVLDLDYDGWDDLYLPGTVTVDKLFMNQKDGTFKDITDPNLAKHNNFNSYTQGGVGLDYDNDGFIDIFMACRRKDLLWRNNGDNTFSNYSQPAGIEEPFDENATNSASYGDFDGDGDNDIYVGRWVKSQDSRIDSFGISHYVLTGFPNQFYVNNNNGTFTESYAQYGVGDTGSTNVCIMMDYDLDGDIDILTGNDFGMAVSPNHVYQNQLAQTGVASFKSVGAEIGADIRIFDMTITPTDYDNDGDFDFFHSSIGGVFLLQNQNGIFKNVAQDIGFPLNLDINVPATPHITWTTLFEDFDNDGREDAFVVHGYIRSIGVGALLPQELDTSRFYYQTADGKFEDVTLTDGVVVNSRGRGACAFDYNHDGMVDIVYGSLGRTPGVNTADFRVFKNVTPPSNNRNWLDITCVAISTAKEAIGTTIEVFTNGVKHLKQVNTGGGMSSSASLVKHFGLGSATVADSIIVSWPMSKNLHRQVDKYYNVPVNQRITYTEQPRNSVINKESINTFSVSPTITHGKIIISGAPDGELTSYEIINVLGVRVAQFEGRKNQVEFSMNEIPSGQYFVYVHSTNRTDILKVIKY